MLMPFQIYPPPAGHDQAPREKKVEEAIQCLKQLHELHPDEITELHFTGNPGCGKSQLALQCAKRLFEMEWFKYIITLDAKYDSTLENSLKIVAEHMGASDIFLDEMCQTENILEKLQTLSSWVASRLKKSNEKWLIVVDNVQDIETVQYIPNYRSSSEWGSGQIIFTSQLEDFANTANSKVKCISLKEGLDFEEAKQLIKQTSQTEATDEEIRETCHLFDFQPLSLALASLEVRYAQSVTWSMYNSMFPQKRRKSQSHPRALSSSDYPESMLDATKGCVQRLRESNSLLNYVFHFLAMCEQSNVPLELLEHYVNSIEELNDQARDLAALEATLRACSLLFVDSFNIQTSGKSFQHIAVRTHQVVNKAFYEDMNQSCEDCNEDGDYHCIERVLDSFLIYAKGLLKPEKMKDYSFNVISSMLQPHFKKLYQVITSIPSERTQHFKRTVFDCFVVFSDVCEKCGHTDSSLQFTEFCLTLHTSLEDTWYKKTLEELALLTMRKVRNLFHCQRPKDALEAASVAVQLAKSNLTCLKHRESELWLANTLLEMGDMSRALEIFKKVESSCTDKKEPGWEALHNDACRSIGDLHHLRGESDKSEERYILSLKYITPTSNPRKHAKTICSMGNLYLTIRDLPKAFECLHEAENMYELLYNSESFHQALPARLLGRAYRLKGNLFLAKHHAEKAVKIYKKSFGKDSIGYAISYDVLGTVYCLEGNLEQAKNCHEHCIEVWKKRNGSNHSDYARFLGNAGNTARFQGNLEGALKYYKEALSVMEAMYEKDTPKLAFFRGKVARASIEMGFYDDNLDILRDLAEQIQQKFERNSSLVSKCSWWLGEAYFWIGQFDDAESTLKKALKDFDKYGSVITGQLYLVLSKVYLVTNRQEDAVNAINTAVTILNSIYGEKSLITKEALEWQELIGLD